VPIPQPADPDAATSSSGAPEREARDAPTSTARRRFLIESSALTTGIAAAPYLATGQAAERDGSAPPVAPASPQRVTFEVNGTPR